MASSDEYLKILNLSDGQDDEVYIILIPYRLT